MISQSNLPAFRPRELADYGFGRARDLAFDAVRALWRRRKQEGMRQSDIVAAIGRDAGWVSRNLRAPGNWTLRTMGELIEGLNGELEIIVYAKEDRPERLNNYSAYAGYERGAITVAASVEIPQVIGTATASASGGGQVIG